MYLPESTAATSASQPVLPARDAMGTNAIDVHLGVTLLLEPAGEPQKRKCCRSPHHPRHVPDLPFCALFGQQLGS